MPGEPLITSLDAIGDEVSSVMGELEELAGTCIELCDRDVCVLDMQVNDEKAHSNHSVPADVSLELDRRPCMRSSD